MRASTILVTFVAAVSAHDFTRIAFPRDSILRRDSSGYEPEITSCGTGTTCAEACGIGYEPCSSTDNKSHCYNPSAGETCCTYSGVGSSCEAGYFCAHNSANTTYLRAVCCANGGSIDECAAKNGFITGILISDPATTSIASSTTTTSPTSSTISIPLTTSVYSTNTTSSVPLYTAPLVTAASISTGFPVHSINCSVLAYTASAAPSTAFGGKVAYTTSSAISTPAALEVITSAGSTVVPIAALALMAGIFAAFF